MVGGWVAFGMQFVSSLLRDAYNSPGKCWTRNVSVISPILYHSSTSPMQEHANLKEYQYFGQKMN